MSEDTSARGAWGKILLLALFVCLLLGGMGGYVWWHHEKWRWEKIPMSDSVAQVPKEWSVGELAERLRDKGRVRTIVTAAHTRADLEDALNIFEHVGREMQLI